MATAQPGTPVSGTPGSFAPPESETGLELEAALPLLSHEPAPALLPSLDEPSGAFAIPPSSVSTVTPTPPSEAGTSDFPIEERFDRMLATLRGNRPQDDLELVRRAWAFCVGQHEGQKRASGEPYIIHPLEVAQVLADLKMDATAIAAGLLHDAVEDTDVSTPEIGGSNRVG